MDEKQEQPLSSPLHFYRCAHAPSCGGCQQQQIPYDEQLRKKQAVVENLFFPSTAKLMPIIPCATFWEYRNKMEYSFSQDKAGKRFLGLMLVKGRGRVFNLQECHLTSSWFTRTLAAVREWWEESGLAAYRPYRNEGHLRTLILREGKRTGDKLAMLTVSGNPRFPFTRTQIQTFVKAISKGAHDKDSLSIFLRVQQAIKGQPTQFFEMHLAGPGYLREEIDIDLGDQTTTLFLKISPSSFFQPNTSQAAVLYSKALQLLALSKEDEVFDLYCGTATLGLLASLQAGKVTGIELNPHAILDAEENKRLNGVDNLDLYCGDVGQVLLQLKSQKNIKNSPRAVIIDPPRAGMSPQAIEHVLSLKAQKILYISCNPKTQKENIDALSALYRPDVLQPVDQFPHTNHIENIALLSLTI
ncbi:MAG: 23S rRNA (uracil(1939)-C(5))-methyltransferase RlmD [Anaerolineae bacterium]